MSREAFEKWIKENQTYNAQELDRGPVIPVDKVRELLQATPPAAVPERFVLVPVEPTQAMIDAGCGWNDYESGGQGTPEAFNTEIYKAMIYAAHNPGVGDE